MGIVITARSFQVTPGNHAPAVVLGIMAGLASWGAFLLKAGVKAGAGADGQPFGSAMARDEIRAGEVRQEKQMDTLQVTAIMELALWGAESSRRLSKNA